MSNKLNGLKLSIKNKARQLGFILTGVTSCQPPAHYSAFEAWLANGNHAGMAYLATEHSRARRADPSLILPECKTILVLALPYSPVSNQSRRKSFRIAEYALYKDYHEIIPPLLQQIILFIEEQVGYPIPNRCYTDTGHILERELAQRAGLGWIGKNSMLLNPKAGSTFFLAEILLGIEIEPDDAPIADHCGTCSRCIEACPTQAILPNRTLDSRRCISYLTIENKADIPVGLRPLMQDWVFGCDVCQMICPWNRFSAPAASALEAAAPDLSALDLILSSVEFNQRFKQSPLKRAKRRGILRNLAVAIGNSKNKNAIALLEQAIQDNEPIVREHAAWALEKIKMNKLLIATNNKGKVKELQDLLKDSGLQLVTPSEINLDLDVEENGATYAENAAKKAQAFAQASGLVSLADDSGLEVDALDGAPGLYSARYHPKPGANDADRRAYMLENLKDKPRPWTAHFHATIAIAIPGGEVQIVAGNCFGEIIPEERGSGGFGYDPIFLFSALGKTMAELGMEEKNRLSHRAKAAQNAIPLLKKILP